VSARCGRQIGDRHFHSQPQIALIVGGLRTLFRQPEVSRMAKAILLQTEHATLWFYADKGILHHKIKGYSRAGEFKQVLLEAADAIEKHHVTKYLSDDSEATVFNKDDAKWASTVWSSRAAKAGLKSWAVIKPTTPLGDMQAESHFGIYERLGVAVKTFASPAEALIWLEKL
jgi:hypothetical protein